VRVAVLGAGPCGITAGLKLAEAGIETLILDRLPFAGGASASRPIGDGKSRMDFGPHVFHVKNPEVNKLFFDYAGSDCRIKKRNERILVCGGLFNYPLDIMEVLKQLTPGYIFWMGTAFAIARVRRKIFPMKEDNFESWGISHFGKPLYEFTCGKYTEKVWGMRPCHLSEKLAQQKLKDLRLRDIASKFFGNRSQELKQYWQDYAYPEDGIGIIFERMASAISSRNGRVELGAKLAGIESNGRKVTAINYKNFEGKETHWECDALVNTIPLTHLANALLEGSSSIKLNSAKNLKYRGLALINAFFDMNQVMPYDWVYLLDEIFQCNRVTEQKNMGSSMIAFGKTVLCFELAATPGDAFWSAPDDVLAKIVKSDMDKIDFIDSSKCKEFYVTRLDEAYPVYTLDFNKHIEETIKELASSENIFSSGRQGLFLNNDIHDSMEMGINTARHIIDKLGTAEWYSFAWNYIIGKIEKKK